MSSTQTLFVWPLYIRLLHWTLALSFALSYISGEVGHETVHEYAGYTALCAAVIRIFLGFLPIQQVRFRDMIYSPAEIIRYALQFFRGNISLHEGHNPLGSLMVFALLLSVFFSASSGLITYTSVHYSGIFYDYIPKIPYWLGDIAEEMHETITSITLILVMLHILVGVVLSSLLLKQNIAKAMLK